MAPVSAPQAPVQTGSADEQQEAFSAIIDRCENFAEDFGAFLGVAEELREVFDADFEQYRLELRADATSQNVTCLRPTDGLLGVAERLEAGAPIRGDGLVEIETEAGRTAQCCDGCGDACSRVVVPRFAVEAECAELCRLANAVMEADLSETVATQLSLASAAYHGGPRLALLMVRQVEKLRRAVAYEYGLPLASVAPHTAMVSRWGPEHGGCADGTPVHGDEAACDGFHYSTIVHLSKQGDLGPDGEILGGGDFAGGDFVFSDVATAASVAAAARTWADVCSEDGVCTEIGDGAYGKSSSGRLLTRLTPQRGRATIFTSGWENLHFVDPISAGVRFAMPAFFVTDAASAMEGEDDMRGAVGRQDVAMALLQHVLQPGGDEDEGQFTALWHAMFAAPLEDVEEEEAVEYDEY